MRGANSSARCHGLKPHSPLRHFMRGLVGVGRKFVLLVVA